jgi:L-lactate dehydrogenase complex protein LldF
VFYSYREKREGAISKEEREELKKKLRDLKSRSIDSISELKAEALKNLKANGVTVMEVKDSAEAAGEISKIIGAENLIVKSKSNTFKELDLSGVFEGKELVETDLGDFLVQISKAEGIHPVLPALELAPEEISEVIKRIFGVEVKPNPEDITSFVRGVLREKILKAKIGITGANVITVEGSIVILENEGNISLVSRIPDKHIVVSSFDKIVPSLEDALTIVRAAAIYGTGQKFPVYLNIISGPSKTADIQNEIVTGAQGAKEVYLILIDNGRSEILNSQYKELLYCINCGACLNFCPVFHQIQNRYGSNYTGAKGVIFERFSESGGLEKAYEAGAFFCTGCSACKDNCPAGIDLPGIIRELREEMAAEGMVPEGTKKAMENIRKHGNAISEVKGAVSAEDLQCC